MWQLFSLAAIFSNTIEETVDKATMLKNEHLDTVVAALVRNVVVFGIAIIVAVLIERSVPSMEFSWLIVLWGLIYAIQAISYTWILKYIEMTAASVSFALLPLIFLPIDLYARNESLTSLQAIGILTLVLGGIVFFVRRDISKNLPLRDFLRMFAGIFAFDIIFFGSEGYLFKLYLDEGALSSTSFLVNGMFYMCLFLTLLLLLRLLFAGGVRWQGVEAYAKGSILAKLADYGNVYFTLQALTLATVSQVAAMRTLHPLVLLIVTFVAQHRLNVELQESFSRATLIQKSFGIALIVLGSYLVA